MKHFLLLLTLFFSTCVLADEPENLTALKLELRRYHDSGEYFYDVSKVDSQAYDFLAERINENGQLKKPYKLAIVLDIDETSLSNYDLMLKQDFSTRWDDAMQDMKATLIPSTLRLVKLAQANNVAVFFITGRPEKLRKLTAQNLNEAGYHDWVKLYLEPNDYKKHSAVSYKSGARREITEKGYDIVINVGDQFSDLKGGYVERSYKLPNPYYYVP